MHQSGQRNAEYRVDGVVVVGVNGRDDDQQGPEQAERLGPTVKMQLTKQGRGRCASAMGAGKGCAQRVAGAKNGVHDFREKPDKIRSGQAAAG